ncbi:hypothetical protein [Thioflexithrix psekupsensis]|nr:hypothetical protein [Thioflexithrix psekupsensis]
MSFDLLDSYIENEYPDDVNGKSFHVKYEKLPETTALEKMVKNIYRILTIYRNAFVHHRSSIQDNGSRTSLEFTHLSKNYKLEISNSSLKEIDSFVMTYLLRIVDYSDLYVECLLLGRHDFIVSGIASFQYGDIGELISVPSGDKIGFNTRYNHSIEEDGIDVSGDPVKFLIEIQDKARFPTDIIVTLNNDKYAVPTEMLSEEKTISRSLFEKFKKKSG